MKKWLPWVCFAATLGWMVLIFGFSAQTGEESGRLSALLAEPLTRLAVLLKGPASPEMQTQLYAQIDGAVRLSAHFTEYAVLGGLLAVLTAVLPVSGIWLPWLIGTIYACTDEWHQAYLPGRVCDPMDVLVDACGVLCGILVFKAITHWRKKHVHHS